MKKTIASASLVVLGAASIQAAYVPDLTPVDESRDWSIGLTLRGFYDDNYKSAPSNVGIGDTKYSERSSWGVQVSPWAALTIPLDQTYIGLSYIFDMKWYESRERGEVDYSHALNFRLNHAFNERYSMDLSDRFISSDEPGVEFGPVENPTNRLATESSRIRNVAAVALEGGIAEQLSIRVSYKNVLVDYEDSGRVNSRSALLDRMEHQVPVEFLYNVNESTSALVGYRYSKTQMTGDDPVNTGLTTNPATPVTSSEYRDNDTHTIYAGAEYEVSSKVDVGLRAGGQFIDYTKLHDYLSSTYDDSSVIPYIDAYGSWTYNPGSTAQLGVQYTFNPTELAGSLNQESFVVWGAVNHKITPKMMASLLAQYQNSKFTTGTYDGEVDQFVMLGANLSYEINSYLSAEAGYNYDRLISDLDARLNAAGQVNRSFTRNRFYIGLRAKY